MILHPLENNDAALRRPDAIMQHIEKMPNFVLAYLRLNEPLARLHQGPLKFANAYDRCRLFNAAANYLISEKMRLTRAATTMRAFVPTRSQQWLEDSGGRNLQDRQ